MRRGIIITGSKFVPIFVVQSIRHAKKGLLVSFIDWQISTFFSISPAVHACHPTWAKPAEIKQTSDLLTMGK